VAKEHDESSTRLRVEQAYKDSVYGFIIMFKAIMGAQLIED